MPHNYEHFVAFALDQPWAITRPMLGVVASLLSRRMAGLAATDEELAQAATLAQARASGRPSPPAGSSVAVLPVHGVIMPRANLFSQISGGTTFEELASDLAALVADPTVGTIVLDMDSPGGSATGATEFAQAVRAARDVKPVIAQAQFGMNSAAYWVGAQASELVAAPSATVGSLGVFMLHDDLSEAFAKEGINRTYISAGKYKVDGNPTTPLSDAAKARMQAMVDQTYDQFVTDVARGRGVAPSAVINGFGQGSTVLADTALAAGMIDRIGTLGDTLARLTTPQAPTLALRSTSASRADDRRYRHETAARFMELSFGGSAHEGAQQ